MQLHYAQFQNQATTYYVASTTRGLAFVGSPNFELTEVQKFYPTATLIPNLGANQTAIQQLKEYLNGERTEFDLAIDLQNGTQFQQKVWRTLQTIPFHTTLSYSELACKVGKPDAIRAVATAVGKNPVMILVPCHRILRKDGSLGGYRGGMEMKQKLLKLEGFS
jgi:O-6-methylguanine DNA methyltransferase